MWTLTLLSRLNGLPPLVLRAVLGVSFALIHGLDKVRPGGTWDFGQAFVGAVDHHFILAYIAVWTEFLGGIALLLGLFTRWASLGLFGVMVYAVLVHHAGDPYKKYELALAYAGTTLVLACIGPGTISLDRLFFGKKALTE